MCTFKATQRAFTKTLLVSPQVNENVVTSSQYWKIETVTPASSKGKGKLTNMSSHGDKIIST